MSITDELRKWVTDHYSGWPSKQSEGYAIADRIDAEHEKATSEFWARINAVPATDENMAEHGWVRLPVDANGEYIHIGDVMEGEKIGGGYGEPFEVVGYVMSNGELEPMDEHRNPRKRKYLRHHHVPTVEGVLREMLCAWEDTPTGEGVDGIIAEYAAKLRLAGDAE